MLYNKTINLAELPIRVVEAARGLFASLHWSTTSEFEDEDSLFDRFCAMLSRLTDEERDLVLTISADFLHCVLTVEDRAMRLASRALAAKPHDGIKQIIAVPLIKPADQGKAKSGAFATYLFRTQLKRIAANLAVPFAAVDRPELLAINYASRTDTLLILIDDFVGSGATAKDAIDEYQYRWAVRSDRILVLALVAQAGAIDFLSAANIDVIAGIVRQRGISDSPAVSDKAHALRVMRALSGRLGVKQELHKLGYNAAEALVSMHRCPNNTFPVYWTDKRIDGLTWPAPFMR
jgi:hypothetical protein